MSKNIDSTEVTYNASINIPVVIDADIEKGYKLTLANDVEGSIDYTNHQGKTGTITAFALKMIGSLSVAKITALTDLTVNDLTLVK